MIVVYEEDMIGFSGLSVNAVYCHVTKHEQEHLS